MRVARLVVVAIVLAFLAPAAPADAGPKNRGRKSAVKPGRTTKGTAAKHQKKLRADRGEVRKDRSPLKAKVATGERPRESIRPGRRVDLSKLPLEEQVAQKIEEILRGPLRDGTTSLFVADAVTGKPLFSVYPDDPLNPASNVKLIASAAALDILGPDFRYSTRILGEAPDAAGAIESDVYLLGTYDPTLGKKGLESLAAQLVNAGVRRLGGDVVVGETPTRDGIYRAFASLSIVAGAPGQPPTVTMSPPNDFMQVVVTATTTKKRRVKKGISVTPEWITDEAGHKRLKVTVAGQIRAGKRISRDVWTRERAYFAAHVLRQALRDAGVEVAGDVHVAELRDYLDTALAGGYLPVPLAEHESKPLAEILQRVNKRSTNWLADRVIMTAAARKYGGKPSMDAAIDAMYAWLGKRTGLDREDLVVDTGSGLSYKTELSARQVVAVLRSALGFGDPDPRRRERLAPLREAYRRSLAIGGKDGTIRKRFKQLQATVLGKTGTLARVVSLAGVVEVSPDRQLVFSIITNGHRPHWKGRVRDGHEKLVALLCDYLHKLGPVTPAPALAPAPVAHASDDDLGITDDADASDEAGVTETVDQ